MSRFRPSPALVVASLALLVSASGVAVAALPSTISNDDGIVSYCYDKATGDISVKGAKVVQSRASAAALPVRCPAGSKGFSFDAEPTVSPNGDFRIDVADTGITLRGPASSVKITAAGVTVNAPAVTVQGSGTTSVRGGSLKLDGGSTLINGGCLPVARQTDSVSSPGNGSAGTIASGSQTVRSC
jgi:phage baseplate assembly protein gpV